MLEPAICRLDHVSSARRTLAWSLAGKVGRQDYPPVSLVVQCDEICHLVSAEARPGAAGQAWNNPCHACSTQFGDVQGPRGREAWRGSSLARLSQPSPSPAHPAFWTRGRDASSVMSLIRNPGPAGRSPGIRPLETPIEFFTLKLQDCVTSRHTALRGPRKWAAEVAKSRRRHRSEPTPRILPRDLLSGRLQQDCSLWGLVWNIKARGCPWRCDIKVGGLSPANLHKIQHTIFCIVGAFLERA